MHNNYIIELYVHVCITLLFQVLTVCFTLQAQTTSNELYSVYKQLQDNITVLDEQIKTVSEEIRTITDKLSHDTTNGPS